MVAIRQAADAGLRYHSSVQLDVRNGHGVVPFAVIQRNRNATRQARAEVRVRLDVLAWPSSSSAVRHAGNEGSPSFGMRG